MRKQALLLNITSISRYSQEQMMRCMSISSQVCTIFKAVISLSHVYGWTQAFRHKTGDHTAGKTRIPPNNISQFRYRQRRRGRQRRRVSEGADVHLANASAKQPSPREGVSEAERRGTPPCRRLAPNFPAQPYREESLAPSLYRVFAGCSNILPRI